MRKLLSAVLFGVLLFRMIDRPVVYLLDEMDSIGVATDLIERLSISKDIRIKVLSEASHRIGLDAPEPADGTIESNGDFYQMVSRQVINDTPHLHCEYDQPALHRLTDLVLNFSHQIVRDDTEPVEDKPLSVLNFMKESMVTGRDHTFFLFEWQPDRIFATSYSKSPRESHPMIPSPPPDWVYFYKTIFAEILHVAGLARSSSCF